MPAATMSECCSPPRSASIRVRGVRALTQIRAARVRRPSGARWAAALAGPTLCLAVPAVALAGGAAAARSSGPADQATSATRWAIVACVVVVLIPAALLARDVVVGKDQRLSTSKTVAAVWTCLIAAAFLGLVVAQLLGHPQALDAMAHSGLAGQYGLLIGGPLGAAIVAKGIVGRQVAEDPAAKSVGEGPSAGQLIQDDAGDTDLGDFQYVLFNLVAIVYFVATLLQHPTAGLPHIPDVLLGLTSVSAAGYVTKKALPSSGATANLDPTSGPPGSKVTITGTGLLTGDTAASAPVMVVFGTKQATVSTRNRSAGVDTIDVQVPAGLTPQQPVDVSVVTSAATRVRAGTFTPSPSDAARTEMLPAQPVHSRTEGGLAGRGPDPADRL